MDRRIWLVAVAALTVAGCAGATKPSGPPAASAGPASAVVPTASPVAVAPTASRTPPATPDPLRSACEQGCQGRIPPGAFTSAVFMPGLRLTFGDDKWFNTADDDAELQFDQLPSMENVLRIYLDPKASAKTDEAIATVPVTPQGLTAWMVGNKDMVVSKPEAVTIGDGIPATTFTVQISDSSKNVDPGCPVRSCLSLLWVAQGDTFAIGVPESVRLYLFTIGSGSGAHTVVISLDTPDFDRLAQMTTDVAAILKSVRLP